MTRAAGAPGTAAARYRVEDFSLYEREQLARIESTPSAPESFDAIAALRRVEALAERLGDESREFYYDNRHTHENGINYVSGMSDGMEQIADRILAAIAAPH